VVRTSLNREPIKPEFWLTGFITNQGAYPWRVSELEARCFDPGGRMVDVHRAQVKEPFVVQPHRENAFRAKLGRVAFTNSGMVIRVRVSDATDGNLPAKPAE